MLDLRAGSRISSSHSDNSQNFCFLSLQLWALLVWSLGFQESNTKGSTEKIWDSPWPFWGPYAMKVKVKVTQSCPTLCDSTDYTVHGILQARILGWVVFSFSRGSSQPRNQTGVSCIAGEFFTNWAIREAHGSNGQKIGEEELLY